MTIESKHMKTIIALLMCASVAMAQQVYTIPYNTKGNSIELAVANTSSLIAEQVKVEVTAAPKELEFTSRTVTLPLVKAQEEQSVTFSFNTGRTAAANKDQSITFTITSKSGQTWTKEIKVRVAPPEVFALAQNYPNPFNPATVISYQLPAVSQVSLKVYDIMGREVAVLVNEQKEPGGYEVVFDASRLASGVYIYRMTAGNYVGTKKFILLR